MKLLVKKTVNIKKFCCMKKICASVLEFVFVFYFFFLVVATAIWHHFILILYMYFLMLLQLFSLLLHNVMIQLTHLLSCLQFETSQKSKHNWKWGSPCIGYKSWYEEKIYIFFLFCFVLRCYGAKICFILIHINST